MTALRARCDLYGQQVFCCTNSCTMSLNMIIWTVFAAVPLFDYFSRQNGDSHGSHPGSHDSHGSHCDSLARTLGRPFQMPQHKISNSVFC